MPSYRYQSIWQRACYSRGIVRIEIHVDVALTTRVLQYGFDDPRSWSWPWYTCTVPVCRVWVLVSVSLPLPKVGCLTGLLRVCPSCGCPIAIIVQVSSIVLQYMCMYSQRVQGGVLGYHFAIVSVLVPNRYILQCLRGGDRVAVLFCAGATSWTSPQHQWS